MAHPDTYSAENIRNTYNLVSLSKACCSLFRSILPSCPGSFAIAMLPIVHVSLPIQTLHKDFILRLIFHSVLRYYLQFRILFHSCHDFYRIFIDMCCIFDYFQLKDSVEIDTYLLTLIRISYSQYALYIFTCSQNAALKFIL